MENWLKRELELLLKDYERGEIDNDKYLAERAALLMDAKEQQDREAIIDAGRGHLVR